MNPVLELRRRAGMTQAALARASGVAQPNIAAYESGKRSPHPGTLDRLRAAAVPRPSVLVETYRDDIRRLVTEHRGRMARIFGSVASGRDRPGSDLDLLVTFDERASLYDQVELQQALIDLLGISVDVVSDGSLATRKIAELHAVVL